MGTPWPEPKFPCGGVPSIGSGIHLDRVPQHSKCSQMPADGCALAHSCPNQLLSCEAAAPVRARKEVFKSSGVIASTAVKGKCLAWPKPLEPSA